MTEAVVTEVAAAPAAAPAAAQAPAAASVAAPAAAEAAAPAPAASALSAGADEAGIDDPTKPWAPPEKYQVKKEDGSLDLEATARKMDGARRNLEMRLGSGDVRPKSADEYAFTPPDGMGEAFDPKDPGIAKFRGEAHKLGLSQKQYQGVMEAYAAQAANLVGGAAQMDTAGATAALREVWPTQESFTQNARFAFNAVQQLAPDLAETVETQLGNNPAFIQIMARVGAQLGEDKSIGGGLGGKAVDINTLLAHPAYSDPKHPEHTSVTAKVNAHFASIPGANNPAG